MIPKFYVYSYYENFHGKLDSACVALYRGKDHDFRRGKAKALAMMKCQKRMGFQYC